MRSKAWGAAGVCVLLFLAGCGTVQEHRARQFPTPFASLPPAVQVAALGGGLEEGWDEVAVYVSLGTPEFATRMDERTVLWAYWGVRPSQVDAGEAGRVFLSRSEFRRRRGGEPFEQLSIFFVDGRVDSWSFSDLSREDLSRQRGTPFGRIPEV
ncbi:MAG: hypothetical protein JJT96_00605 [Opitutales bacterium]|nr:hypothetical protein [Opitutales bacterium]